MEIWNVSNMLMKNGCPWDERTFIFASKKHEKCIQYAIEKECPQKNKKLNFKNKCCVFLEKFSKK
jgi:hypothetical protein